MTTASPAAAARSTGERLAKPSRRRSSSASSASSGTSACGAPDLEALPLAKLGDRPDPDLDRECERLALGRAGRRRRAAGRRSAVTPESSSARSYHSGRLSRRACSSTASRPRRWITSCGGTLPLRKPAIFISPASWPAARSTRLATSVGLDLDLDLDPRLGELSDVCLHGAAELSEAEAEGRSRAPPLFRRLVSGRTALTSLGPMDPGATAIGTWSGGRFMHFGEPVDEDRLIEILRPGRGIDTVITADVYGQGAADSLLGRALEGVDRSTYCLVGDRRSRLRRRRARRAPRAFRDSPTRRFAVRPSTPTTYAARPRRASSASASTRSTSSSSTTPTGSATPRRPSGTAMDALRDAGLTEMIGVAPGPANGFTLDLISTASSASATGSTGR